MLVSQITLVRNENPDTLASHNCTEDHSIVIIGAAFSLIVIMLQVKSPVRVHPPAVSNILIVQKLKLSQNLSTQKFYINL